MLQPASPRIIQESVLMIKATTVIQPHLGNDSAIIFVTFYWFYRPDGERTTQE